MKKIIKIIDLLVKIADDEELPKEIQIFGNNYVLRYDNCIPNYFRKDKIGIPMSEDFALIKCLNNEIKIIEDKEIRSLPPYKYEDEVLKVDLAKKIDELVIAVNELKKEDDK